MIVCPHCNHQNPDEAIQCEACYTPLPTTTNCPNCGAPVQTDATFCGQCGFSLKQEMGDSADDIPETIVSSNRVSASESEKEEAIAVAQSIQTKPVNLANSAVAATDGGRVGKSSDAASSKPGVAASSEPKPIAPPPSVAPPVSANPKATKPESEAGSLALPEPPPSKPLSVPKSAPKVSSPPKVSSSPSPPPTPYPSTPMAGSAPTRLQIQTASLLHVQTQTRIELSYALPVIHIGKPNEQIPPDVDVSGFPDSEIVSRVHADIRVEGDTFYIEDMGSSNGTYINHTPLLPGNRHRLRSGDRIGLGKGDKVTFIFQLS
ncbi:peptide-binding protein [Hydrococcus rivularis NIES-593]|uniref:Peptide-binding protein n=1 Tax=Hydrococcus rivularis NIES-593 TaxID=1921803 RepID=A0A1U7HHB3_9CYAN|nr:FHA domain-containing protein [Hydrococcus rivularis]OKH22957.1 peptide-binding protein [Hydrococcus rivularis NIES-593]